ISAWHNRAAVSATVASTGARSNVERLMTKAMTERVIDCRQSVAHRQLQDAPSRRGIAPIRAAENVDDRSDLHLSHLRESVLMLAGGAHFEKYESHTQFLRCGLHRRQSKLCRRINRVPYYSDSRSSRNRFL